VGIGRQIPAVDRSLGNCLGTVIFFVLTSLGYIFYTFFHYECLVLMEGIILCV
jgi:hypothetical protein